MDRKRAQPHFVGESRILLVDGLLKIFDSVNKLGRPRWVSLEAPSGWGKTRVAQELYARLAARQSQRYWPASIPESTDADLLDIASCRKRVYPEPEYFDRAAGSLPEFMWWGLACDLRNGLPSQTLMEDLQQLEAHAPYLEAAWSALAAFHENRYPTLAQAREVLVEILNEATEEGLGTVVEAISSKSVPLLGLAVSLGKWGIGKARKARKVQAAIEAAGPLDAAEQKDDLLQESITMLARMARPGLPVVVFVEDLHKASPLMKELVERILRTNAAILLLTTTWPGELEQCERLSALSADEILKPRILRVRHNQPVPAVFPEGASLGELPGRALRELILSYYPDADNDTLSRLAERYNNPLPLELVCTLPKYQNRFGRKGDLKLPAEEIERLPGKVEDLYRELWNTLPEETQQALALATLAIPDNTTAWYNPVTRRAIAQCRHLTHPEGIASALDQDQIPHGWTRAIERWLQRFNEPDQLRIARRYVDDHYFEDEIDRYLDQLARALSSEKLDTDDIETQHCAWLRIALHRKGKTGDADALEAIRLLQDALKDNPRELPARLELGRYLDQLEVDEDSAPMLLARADYLHALAEAGDLESALKLSDSLLSDTVRILGPDHPVSLTRRNNIASWLAQSGQIEESLAQFETLLRDEQRILEADHPSILTTRNNISFWLAESGQVAKALSRLQSLLEDLTRILGPDHANTLSTRNNIAGCLAKSGREAEALVQFQALLQDRQRILGPDHIETLTIRNNIATSLAESGQVSEGLSQLETLLEDQLRILGPDHPHTLRTRSNIITYSQLDNQTAKGLSRAEALLQDQLRILGPEHPDTLVTRNNIAYVLVESGRISEGLSQLETLLEDQLRTLAPDHPYVLGTRHNIAFLLARSGQIDEGLAQFEALLQDQLRILGPDHPDTLTTRNNIAPWLAESDQFSEAFSRFQTQLQDQLRILGPDHPETLTTRSNIAYWLADSGQRTEALLQFESLLLDQQRILGADHPDTLRTRENIDFCRTQPTDQ